MVPVGAANFAGGEPQRAGGVGGGSVQLLADASGHRGHQRYAVVAKTNPWVMSSVGERASLAARAPMHTFRPTEPGQPAERERVRVGDGGPGESLARLLSSPGEGVSGSKLRRRMARDRLVHGNAFAEFVYDGARVVGLQWHPWVGIEPLYSDDGLSITAFRVPVSRRINWLQLPAQDTRTRTVAAEDALHLVINDDTESPLGISPLESLHATHALHEAAWRFARSYLENGMFPSGVVEMPEKATVEQARVTRQLLSELNTGIDRGGKPGIIGFGKWQQVMATPEGAKLVELAKASREEVATAYRMAWLGNVEDMNRATAEQARQAFIRDVVGEDVGEQETELNVQLVGRRPRWSQAGVFVEAELGELLRPDMEGLATVIQTEVGAPVLTINEGRALLNKPPLPDGDRIVLNPGTPDDGAGASSQLVKPESGELLAAAVRAGSNGQARSGA